MSIFAWHSSCREYGCNENVDSEPCASFDQNHFDPTSIPTNRPSWRLPKCDHDECQIHLALKRGEGISQTTINSPTVTQRIPLAKGREVVQVDKTGRTVSRCMINRLRLAQFRGLANESCRQRFSRDLEGRTGIHNTFIYHRREKGVRRS
jgi:hypothetical protein